MPSVRRCAAALSLLVAGRRRWVTFAGGGAAAVEHDRGARGSGTRYFPKDGNGGYDVTHYDIHDTYRLAHAATSPGGPRSRRPLPRTCRRSAST